MGIFAPFSYFEKNVVVPSGLVTDQGIVLLDATNPSSYPGSGNTWTDLSGTGNNADVSLITSYWNAGGYFDFPGTDYTKVATVTANSSLDILDGDFTWLVVGTVDATATGFGDNAGPFGMDSFPDNPGVGFLINRLTGGAGIGSMSFYLNNSNVGYSGVSNKLFTSIGDWFVAHVVRSGSSVNYYKTDNASIASFTNSTNANNNNNIIIGRGNDNATSNYKWDCKIAAIGLYDKALSEDERQQNIDYFSSQLGF